MSLLRLISLKIKNQKKRQFSFEKKSVQNMRFAERVFMFGVLIWMTARAYIRWSTSTYWAFVCVLHISTRTIH